MAGEIQEPSAGESVNKLWRIVAKCAKSLNAFRDAKVTPNGSGKFIFSDGNVVLDLSPLKKAAEGGGKITVTAEDASGYAPGTGVGTIENVDVLTFDSALFEIYDGGGGQAVVKLKTTTC